MTARSNNSIISEMKISFDGSDYGKNLYREVKRKAILKSASREMIEIENFMNTIEGVPSPIREEAFVSFCLRNSKRACQQISKAA